MQIVALKQIHKTAPGGTLEVTHEQARALIAIGIARAADGQILHVEKDEINPRRGRYARKDIRAAR